MRRTGISIGYLLMSVYFCWPLFAKPLGLGGNDWDQHLFYYAAVLKNIVEYGQAPFWNPWYCGGDVMWQNPQIAIVSPMYPLTALMPIQLAMKVNIVLHYWIGFLGMHVMLTRGIGLRFLPAVIYLATLVTASGAAAIHLAVGHSVFLPGFYLPWLVFFVMRSIDTGWIRQALVAGAILALMVFAGGTHILPMAFASVGLFAGSAALFGRHWRPLIVAAIFVVASLAFAAPKLLPVSLYVTGDQFWDTRNPTEHPDRMTLEMLRHAYLDPGQGLRSKFDEQRHGWHEYGNYIGPFSALVLLVSVGWMFARGERRLAITTVGLFLLSLGEFSAWAPASLATHVPLFSSFRIPSRYTIPFVLFGGMCAAAAAAHLLRTSLFSGKAARIAVSIVCVVATAHLMYVNRQLFANVFGQDPFDTSFHWMSGPHQITTDADSSPYRPGSPMLRALMEDRAFFYCYESLQLVRNASPGAPQIFGDENSQLVSTSFTPNRFEFKAIGGAKESLISLNQNWAQGWTNTAGPFAEFRDRMPGVFLKPGQTGTFAFEFVPPGLVAGSAIFLMAVISAAALWRRSL